MAAENVAVGQPVARGAERTAEQLSSRPGEDHPSASDAVISVRGLRMS